MSTWNALTERAAELRPADDVLQELETSIPASYTLSDLVQYVKRDDQSVTRPTLLALLACLKYRQRIKTSAQDDVALRELTELVAWAIAPLIPARASPDEDEDLDNDVDEDVSHAISQSKLLGELGLDILGTLSHMEINGVKDRTLSDDVLLTISSFTNSSDPWTSNNVVPRKASRLLEDYFDSEPSTKREDFITETILRSFLRPLFTRSRPETVTASGRVAAFPSDKSRPRSGPLEDRTNRPWKYGDLRALPVLSWAVNNATAELIAKTWPLFTPPLLTLLDDGDTRIRVRGLKLLGTFLEKFEARLLRQTGLAKVFEEAVFPTLLYLPSLTPVDESVALLGPAYDTLFVLGRKLDAGDQIDSARAQSQYRQLGQGKEKRALLDKVFREGIFAGYFHAREYMRISGLLLGKAEVCVREMGIGTVKHLKDLIPMLTTIMSDPFATSHPPLVLAALATLQTTMTICWPRLGQEHWRNEILKALVLCWLHFNEEGEDGRKDVEKELIKAAKTLAAIAQSIKSDNADAELGNSITPLIAKEPSLRGLFGIS